MAAFRLLMPKAAGPLTPPFPPLKPTLGRPDSGRFWGQEFVHAPQGLQQGRVQPRGTAGVAKNPGRSKVSGLAAACGLALRRESSYIRHA